MADQVQITLGANVQGAIASLRSFGAAAGAMSLAFVAAISAATKSAINLADEMGKAAQRAGATVEEFSRLAYAGKLSGIETDALSTAFKGLSKAMSENSKTFEQIKVSVFNNDGSYRRTSDVLGDIADKFQQMPDGIRKTNAAVAIFGKAGQSMIPLLNQGKGGLKDLKKEADDLGVTISREFANQSEQFNDNITRIEQGLRGMANTIAKEVLPTLITLTESVVTLLKEVNNTGSGIGAAISFVKDAWDIASIGAQSILLPFVSSITTLGPTGAISFKEAFEEMRRMRTEFEQRKIAQPTEPHKMEEVVVTAEIEKLTAEEAIRLRLQRNEALFADKSKRWDLDSESRRRADIVYLEQKESLLQKLKLAIDPEADNLNTQLERASATEISKADAEREAKLLPVLREKAQITERLSALRNNDPKSIKDQTRNQLTELGASFGTAAQNIAAVFVSPLQGAFDGLQSSIHGLIKGTMSWKNALTNVASSIVEQMVSAIAMLIAKAIILATVIAALNAIAPGVGSALGFAAGIGARAEGGLTGPGIYTVGEQGPEYVINNKTLNRLGPAYFDALQQGKTPAVAGGGSSTSVHMGFIGGPAMVGQWLESREGRKYIIDIADQRIREARG